MNTPPAAAFLAEAHLAIREGRIDEGLDILKESEEYNRNKNNRHIGDYIATERLEVLLANPDHDYNQLWTAQDQLMLEDMQSKIESVKPDRS